MTTPEVSEAADAADVPGVPEVPGVRDVPGVPGVPDALEVRCPLCKVPADRRSLACPSCREDLGVLFRLRYAGRIDYNRALAALGAGEEALALGLLHRALEAEPGLEPARELLGSLSVSVVGGPGAERREGRREADTPSE
ncbi:hypothetical protein AB0F71_34465 [Kitasatospora sp. NPDC028055]|uniref:hypothetical protein n=1 Tax=Kitasatospora sp. NPDC028055 TaxID=3155653 RepID=UPI0033EAF13E